MRITGKKVAFIVSTMLLAVNSVAGVIVYSGTQNHGLRHLPEADDTAMVRIAFSNSPNDLRINNETRTETFAVLGDGAAGTYASYRPSEHSLAALPFGQVIDGSVDWSVLEGGPYMIADYTTDTQSFRGHFFDQENQYLPIRTTLDDDIFYGWIRMSHSMENEILTVHDWAYNSEPGEPIMAGEIPEPKVYALILGLGALGFVAWRRRTCARLIDLTS